MSHLKVLEILVEIILVLHQIPGGNTKEIFQLDIDERGTLFNETVEIDDQMKTVVYKVPSHNEIKKTDILVDYKNGYFVTRIPERGACFIQAFPTADEQSLEQTRQNLKLLQYFKSKTKTAVPVKTVKTIMKLIREIPRDELSPKIAKFCGNNTSYQVREEVVPQKNGKSIAKRSGSPKIRFYTVNLYRHALRANYLQKDLPNGYLTCKKVEEHTKAVLSCVNKDKPVKVGCGLYPITCRYQAFCDLLPESQKKILTHAFREGAGYIAVEIKCVEEHKFTEAWCCDVLPC